MIPLPATAVIEDRVTAVSVADACESRGHLADRGVPVDLLERAVGAPPQRRGDAIAAVLVVIEAMRLLARVALRGGMALVAAQLDEVAIRFAAELNLQPAVALAQDAGRRLPVGHA